jgi:hypothetical protein
MLKARAPSLMFELDQDHALFEAPTASYGPRTRSQIVPFRVNPWISEWAFECLGVDWITQDFRAFHDLMASDGPVRSGVF